MTHGGYGGGPAAPSGGDPFGGDAFAGDPFAVGRPGASASHAPAPTSQQQETNTLATLSVVFAFVFAPPGPFSATWRCRRFTKPQTAAETGRWSASRCRMCSSPWPWWH